MEQRVRKVERTKEISLIRDIFKKLLSFLPFSVSFTLLLRKEATNEDGGGFSVAFHPQNTMVELFVYKNGLKEAREALGSEKREGILVLSLAHEVGHITFWEVWQAARSRFISEGEVYCRSERCATNIGWVLSNLYWRGGNSGKTEENNRKRK